MNRRNQQGITSILVLGVMFVLVVLGLGLAGVAANTAKRSSKETRAVAAFQAAQAGLDYQIAASYAQLAANNGLFVQGEHDLSDAVASFAPGSSATASVLPLPDPASAWITCTATMSGKTSSVRVLVLERDVSIWNNAIFAGTGAAGQTINGNVDIRGSVHILGDGEYYSDLNGNGHWDAGELYSDSNHNGVWDPGEPFTDTNGDGVRNPPEPYNDANANGLYDPPLTVTDLASTFGGTAYIGNNYSGMPVGLRALVPAPPNLNGVEQLGTEVRAKHGQVSISGNATIGSGSAIDNGNSKSTVDGVFVNDGFTGNKGSSSVFSDNGTSNQYDLGYLGFKFPMISGLGAEKYTDKGGTTWDVQETYLNNRSLSVPVTQITATTAAFHYGPDQYGNEATFTPKTKTTEAVLDVKGVVKVPGSLQIGASKETIRYTGNGTIYTPQDINISSNLLPASGRVFPTTARLGLIAKRNMGLATGGGDAQLSMAGAFYAQGTIRSAKQNQIAGTFVANFYDMGTNVPNIYQVPTLKNNMPPAMPGDKGYYSIKVKSWRERATH